MTAPTQSSGHLGPGPSFAPADRERWRELVAEALRRSGRIGPDQTAGAVESVLSSTTYEGIRVLPLYTAADVAGPVRKPVPAGGTRPDDDPDGPPPSWDVRQMHRHSDAGLTREAVLTDLENGATSVWLVMGDGGIRPDALAEILRDVRLDLAPVVLDAGAGTGVAADEFFALARDRGGSALGNLGADPIGLRARTGDGVDVTAGLDEANRLARRCLAATGGLRAITVDATPYHDAGGSGADELGASIATGVAYLRALTEAGLSAPEAFGQLEFRYAAGADQFFTIATFRAARRLWARVAQVCGLAPGSPQARQRQHAVTSSAMMTRRDPWVNLLRTTLACFGAGVGGADAVTVQPFDAAIGQPDAFSLRLARNTSSLLTMEAQVARVADPVGGSWYVERLTADLAEASWRRFTEIEREGGIVAALDSGLVTGWLAAAAQRRADDIAHRRAPITGVSEFPDLTEKPVRREPWPTPPESPLHRHAEPFEALRDAADDHAEATGSRPAVFLATIGPIAVHGARAGFAAGLFQAGGLATPVAGPQTDAERTDAERTDAERTEAGQTDVERTEAGQTDVERIAAEFTASGTSLACLASSDKLYDEHAAAVAGALRAAGAQHVWLAGRPGERADTDAAAGVTGYLYQGCDALEMLREAHRCLGVTPR